MGAIVLSIAVGIIAVGAIVAVHDDFLRHKGIDPITHEAYPKK